MTSISGLGGTNSSWMISQLLGKGSSAGSASSGATSSAAAIQNIVSTASAQKMAHSTASAALALRQGGAPKSENDIFSILDKYSPQTAGQDLQTRLQEYAAPILKANAAMTSSDVQAAMYGAGIPDPTKPGATITLSGLIARDRSINESNQEYYANSTELSAADKQVAAQQDDTYDVFLNKLENAFNNGTLKIQNAADVSGLSFKDSFVAYGTALAQTTSYDQDFYMSRANKDATRMFDTGGGLTLYLSW